MAAAAAVTIDASARKLQGRFVHALAAALRGRLAYAEVPVANEFVQLDAILASPAPDVPAARQTMANVLSAWSRQQFHSPQLSDEVRVLMTQCLEALAQAVDRLASPSPDEFVNATFRCRDRIVSLNLMLRANPDE